MLISLLELFAERRKRHPLGTIDTAPAVRRQGSKPLVLFRGLLALALLVLAVTIVLLADSSAGERVAWLLLLVLYLAIGASLYPKPDYRNVGLLGGMIDHPFRFTDDLNRCLVVLLVVFWPARFATRSIRDLASLFL